MIWNTLVIIFEEAKFELKKVKMFNKILENPKTKKFLFTSRMNTFILLKSFFKKSHLIELQNFYDFYARSPMSEVEGKITFSGP